MRKGRGASVLLRPKFGYRLAAEIWPGMVMELDLPNVPAICPRRAQIDRRRLSAGSDALVEPEILNLPIAKNHFNTVELDVVIPDSELDPLEFAIAAADLDAVVIVDEADPAFAQPLPFPRRGRTNRQKCQKCRDHKYAEHTFLR